MDLISIILPYHKKRNFIDQTIRSILSQSYKKFELIIIYDDSDKTDLFFLKKLIKNNSKIKIVVNKNNIGAGRSRNIGLLKSKGRYICFIDADDIWTKNKLRIQINFMKKNKLLISCTSYKVINEQNKIISHRKSYKSLSYTTLLRDCSIGLSTVMLDSSILKNKLKFANLKTKEDFVLWLKISKTTNIVGIGQFLSYWRDTKNSLSKNIVQKIFDGYRVYRIHMDMSIAKSIYFLIFLSINHLIKKIKSTI
tara:strand:- start:6629 stop:7384 length:756 start_codon:yes stop_codon:yes gene_type:complete